MKISLPDFCLVALIGSSGSGKSTFARRHFKPTEIVSSDACRGFVEDDENSLDATNDAFALLHFIAEMRLKRRKIVVVDATNVRKEDRAQLVRIAKKYHALAVAIVLNPGEDICHVRNKTRADRQFGPQVVRNQTASLKRGIRGLDKEGFRYVHELRSVETIDAVEIERTRLWTDARHEAGPFDIIGDVHGCADELEILLAKLGYAVAWSGDGQDRACSVVPPAGRRAIFVGDLVDRGPRSPDVLRLVHAMAMSGAGFCVPGNHDVKLVRWLNGRNVKLTHGLAETVAQLEQETPAFREQMKTFIDGLVSHLWLDGGKLAVAHAGIKEAMIGRSSGAVREFCLYGETTGETDEYGLPVRHNWAAEYHGDTTIVYGHTPVVAAEWLNRTICLDTGCAFGGKLTALRWPEKELVEVPAARTYCEPVRPLAVAASGLSLQQAHDDVLDLSLVTGKRIVETRLGRTVTIEEGNAAAALEVMTRFAVHPKWLIHLPPTMSPSATTGRDGLLEHPDETFAYFRNEGVSEVVVEEKHMGSRALLAICRDEKAARDCFGVTTGETGMVYTRTGRAFFQDRATTEAVLARVRSVMTEVAFWERHQTTWALLDAEIMPWSAKAQSLIREQYASTGAAARAGLAASIALLEGASARDPSLAPLLAHFRARGVRTGQYAEAYRRYCWPVTTIDDYRVAPFHLLATEGAVHMDKDHLWHMAEIARLAEPGHKMLVATAHHLVDLADAASVETATQWWSELTARGGEGMVVKPRTFVTRGRKGLVQPALKCRGPEYLRIIYGPEYDAPEHLARLRSRGLGKKRSLALREFFLGHEALQRFIEREPLRRIHEVVFAILALESEPVDPRL
jgi:polynucleotide kinase-phosphatase